MSNEERARTAGPRWYRNLRRWARHTPNGDIALNLIGAGAFLAVVAVILGFFLL